LRRARHSTGVAGAGLLAGWHAADIAAVRRLARPPGPTERHPLTTLQWDLPLPAGGGGGGDALITVTAAPLLHRLPCWGYVFQEAAPSAPAAPASGAPHQAGAPACTQLLRL